MRILTNVGEIMVPVFCQCADHQGLLEEEDSTAVQHPQHHGEWPLLWFSHTFTPLHPARTGQTSGTNAMDKNIGSADCPSATVCPCSRVIPSMFYSFHMPVNNDQSNAPLYTDGPTVSPATVFLVPSWGSTQHGTVFDRAVVCRRESVFHVAKMQLFVLDLGISGPHFRFTLTRKTRHTQSLCTQTLMHHLPSH